MLPSERFVKGKNKEDIFRSVAENGFCKIGDGTMRHLIALQSMKWFIGMYCVPLSKKHHAFYA